MLHILLLILKIIGIILAVILGILVLLACIVVFVPVRYELKGKGSGPFSTLKVKGKVTWLFSLVRADIYYKENKLKWRLRIAWKKIPGGKGYGAEVTTQDELSEDVGTRNKKTKGEEDEERYEEAWKKNYDDEESAEAAWDEAEEGREAQEIRKSGSWEGKEAEEDKKNYEKTGFCSFKDEEGQETFLEELGEDEEIYKEIFETGEEEDTCSKEGDCKEHRSYEEQDGEDGGRIKGIISKIKGIYRRIKYTFQSICAKIKELLEKKDKLVGFIRDEAHVGAFGKAKKEVFKILRKLKPKKFLLEARFGFDDPSWTGRTLAAAALLYPFFREAVVLRPDFTKKVLEGKLYAKGHIRFCHFAVMAWNLFWNRNVRRTYMDIRNFEI